MSVREDESRKRIVLKTTVDKWISKNDRTLNTAVWLSYEADLAICTRIVSLKCSVCSKFCEKLIGMRNYNSALVEGFVNLRISRVKDHVKCDMHSRAMLLLKKQVRKCASEE